MPKTALLIIDVINGMDFPEAKKLLKNSLPIAPHILALKKRFKKKGAPVIFVNDSYGHWRSNWEQVYADCVHPSRIGSKFTQLFMPEEDDYVVLKPKHSGFYSSNLENLLNELDITKVVITGIAGNICVLFTVNDAYMRGYEIHVPSNCIASNTKFENNYALSHLKTVFRIKTSPSKSVKIEA